MSSTTDPQPSIPPSPFVFLHFEEKRGEGAFLETKRLGETPKRLYATTPDEIELLKEFVKHIDQQIEILSRQLKS